MSSLLYSFVWLNSISLYRETLHCLCIHPLISLIFNSMKWVVQYNIISAVHGTEIFYFKLLTLYAYSWLTNVVIVSGGKQSYSTIYMYPFSLKLPSHPSCHIALSRVCYIVETCCLSILNIAVCTFPSQTPKLSLSLILPPAGNRKFIFKSISHFPFCKWVHLYHFFLDSTYKGYYLIFLCVFDLLHSTWQSVGPSMLLQMTLFHSF